ncbi:hypothetical protein GNI_033400 [Gregarina niphandrodes]|uniref:Uncharacterized protein n=1 Tax=Gregarina niphandrodes TaxID=110365 RepID=A0A023BB55_GRENI|nr:hypothetical protein GNI_033400 [Gregarina niphandrodes]EZG78675.1 hypothetical protein GNI_033400 [Gregarina niphandrodes]|eukprot:XP_011129212.1 hypothetical protein GNI_033400 [Gregarina niphandrodes]
MKCLIIESGVSKLRLGGLLAMDVCGPYVDSGPTLDKGLTQHEKTFNESFEGLGESGRAYLRTAVGVSASDQLFVRWLLDPWTETECADSWLDEVLDEEPVRLAPEEYFLDGQELHRLKQLSVLAPRYLSTAEKSRLVQSVWKWLENTSITIHLEDETVVSLKPKDEARVRGLPWLSQQHIQLWRWSSHITNAPAIAWRVTDPEGRLYHASTMLPPPHEDDWPFDSIHHSAPNPDRVTTEWSPEEPGNQLRRGPETSAIGEEQLFVLPVQEWARLHEVLGSNRFEQFIFEFKRYLQKYPECRVNFADGRTFTLVPEEDGLTWHAKINPDAKANPDRQ